VPAWRETRQPLPLNMTKCGPFSILQIMCLLANVLERQGRKFVPYIDAVCLHFHTSSGYILLPGFSNTFFFFFFFNLSYNPWWVLACFMILFHNLLSLHLSLFSFSLSSSLDPLLLGQAISVLVFLLVFMSVVPIRLLF